MKYQSLKLAHLLQIQMHIHYLDCKRIQQNVIRGISFKEVVKALKNEDGRKIVANYGLDPKLGKYHRTFCEKCGKPIEGKAPITHCPDCDSSKITMGVFDRIEIIKDKEETKSPSFRPPYVYQIPLTFMPD